MTQRSRLMEIQKLRHKRAYYTRLGKRKAVSLVEMQLRSLMMRQLGHEELQAEIQGDLDACTEVYR